MSELITNKLKTLVAKGQTEGKFGKLENAKIFSKILENKGISSRINEILGNARTLDTPVETILKKHFLVSGDKTPAHRIIGKFV